MLFKSITLELAFTRTFTFSFCKHCPKRFHPIAFIYMSRKISLILFLFFFSAAFGQQSPSPIPPFVLSEYLPQWEDSNDDCRNTRNQILLKTSLRPVIWEKQSNQCVVKSGKWADPFTGDTIFQAANVEIMHLVDLEEAHRSGAWKWPEKKKQLFANSMDMENQLIPVALYTPELRKARDPGKWLPSNTEFILDYVRSWCHIKVAWNLTADRSELVRIKGLLPKPLPVGMLV